MCPSIPAAKAGVLRGAILLALDDVPVSVRKTFIDYQPEQNKRVLKRHATDPAEHNHGDRNMDGTGGSPDPGAASASGAHDARPDAAAFQGATHRGERQQGVARPDVHHDGDLREPPAVG